MSSNPWDAGWPRKRIPYTEDETLPALFVGGQNQEQGDWLSFADDAMSKCRTGACAVCGEALQRIVVFGQTYAFASNGPPVHPRCFAMTLRFCPHFQNPPWTHKHQTVAYVYDGDNYTDAIKASERSFSVAEGDGDPFEYIAGEYGLKRGKVQAFKRGQCIELAKSDPLGAGS